MAAWWQAGRWMRWLNRVYARRSHALFVAHCAHVPSVTWPAGEQAVQFSKTQPLSSADHQELLALWPDAGPYLKAVACGEAMGLLVRADGRIVHSAYVLIGNKTLRILGCDRSSGLLANASTVPDYRGRGCQTRSVATRLAMSAQAGFREVVAETALDNQHSQRALLRAGLRSMGVVRLVLLLSVLVIRTEHPEGAAKRWDLCL